MLSSVYRLSEDSIIKVYIRDTALEVIKPCLTEAEYTKLADMLNGIKDTHTLEHYFEDISEQELAENLKIRMEFRRYLYRGECDSPFRIQSLLHLNCIV